MSTHNFQTLEGFISHSENFTEGQLGDLYQFTLSGEANLNLDFTLSNFEGAIDWTLETASGDLLETGSLTADSSEFSFNDLSAGSYELQLDAEDATEYEFTLEPEYDPVTGMEIVGGYFVVEEEEVTVDFAIDGGKYQGQLGIFSLEGLDEFEAGSPEWIEEVARRSLSGTTLGHVVIDDTTDAARLNPSFDWESPYNLGTYAGRNQFAMNVGDRMGLILVPNGSIQDVFQNPELEGNKRPLFSLASANPDDMFPVGQITDAGENLFVLEDERVDLGSDKDYNDIGFKLEGVTSQNIEDIHTLINDRYKDWPDTVDFHTAPKIESSTLEASSLKSGDDLTLDLTISDPEGIEDVVQIKVSILDNDGENLSSFTLSEPEFENIQENQGDLIWEKTLQDFEAGDYQITVVAEDSFGETSEETAIDFTIETPEESPQPPVPEAPTIQSSSLTSQSLQTGESLTLDLQIADEDGIEDVTQIEIAILDDSGNILENFTLSDPEFQNIQETQADLIWNYQLEGFNSGDYKVTVVAEDSFGKTSEAIAIDFTVQDKNSDSEPQAPIIQSSSLASQSLQTGESLTLDLQIADEDGIEDVTQIKLEIVNSDGDILDGFTLSDPDFQNVQETQADLTWNYQLDDFEVGDYQITVVAKDSFGNTSQQSAIAFTVNTPEEYPKPPENNAPKDLRFSILPVYTTGEALNFDRARVSDPDGVGDLDRVDFWLETSQGQRIEITSEDPITFVEDDRGRGRFDFEYDLGDLAPGSYQLKAIAYDKQGAVSEVELEQFSLISDLGDEELSDPVRLAIGATTDLDDYTTEEIENTENWVVWLTPGTDATALANSLEATNLGESGFIPNTYIWDFDDDLSAAEITSAISETPTLELAYPDVPIPLRLLNHKPDYLEEHQWSLHQPIDPSDPNSTVTGVWTHPTLKKTGNQWLSGEGVVIGVIDDGLKYNHIEFNPEAGGRYRTDLSWDYTDGDNDPYPKSIRTETVALDIQDFSQDSFSFDLPVTLTGVVIDVDISFENTDLNPGELKALENIAIELVSPEKTLEGLGDWISLRNYYWFFLGWNDLRFATSDFIEADENGEFSLLLDDGFDRSFSGGNWKLQFYNGTYGPIQENWKSVVEKLGSFSMEITTLHPHGTAVAGVVADEAQDMGTRGVAPNADISALRLIGNIDAFDMTYDAYGKDIADALYNNDRNSEIDIFNSSWSSLPFQHQVLAPFALERGAKYGLNGLGNSYIFSAGNDRSRDFGGGLGYAQVNNYSLTNSRHAIAVGAVTFRDENGSREIVRATYSNPGVFVSAFSNNGSLDNLEGTDILTPGVNVNHLEKDTYLGYPQDRSGFGGTSAAAPFVSGVVALMREANPNLTNRDIQHILAESSYKVDPNHQPEELDPDYNRPQQGWTTNGAGYDINYQYGFGAVNPTAAVELAADWTSVKPELRVITDFQNVNDNLPNGGSTGLSDSVRVESDIKLEWVEVVTDIDHEDWNDLTVILTSPDGTESVLRHSVANPDTSDVRIPPLTPKDTLDTGRWTFTTPRFWGESSEGEWTLQVLDEKGNEIEGDWNAWQLNLYGTEPQTAVSLEVLDAEAHEDGDAAVFAVTREDNLDEALVVNYQIGGTANPDNDYQPLTGSITLEPGEKGATISVVPNYDLLSEGNETVSVTLTAGEDYDFAGNTSGTATIENSSTISRYGNFIYENPETGNLYILTEPDTWYGAQAQAEALGGDLVTINDQNEQDWLLDTFGTQESLWMGLTDNELYSPSREFTWISGEPVTYTNWHPSEPNNGSINGNEDFGHFNHDTNNFPVEGKWNDLPPSLYLYGIAEIDPSQLDNPIVTMMVTDAEAGEDGNAGQIVIQRFDDLSQDLTLDLSVSGTATPGSDYEALPSQVTIPAGEKLVTVPIHAIADWQNESAETVIVEIQEGNYTLASQATGQVAIENFVWMPTWSPIYTHPETGNRYLLTEPDTWLGAQEQAEALGGRLATIESAEENQWLSQLFGELSPWIGLTDSPIHGEKEGDFQWVGKETTTYTNWWPGEPNNVKSGVFEGEDFVHLVNQSYWHDLLHNPEIIGWSQRPGIIEIPAEPQANWKYSIDSFDDSMAGYEVGNTKYEIYGTAIKQTEDSVYLAINSNLPLTGTSSEFAADNHVGWGDILFNFSGNNLDTANANGDLFGIRFAQNSDSGVPELGVYQNVRATDIATENGMALWDASLQGYINWIRQYGGTPDSGDLSAADPYFNLSRHVPNSMVSGAKIGDVEIVSNTSNLGLNFAGLGATAPHTIVLKFDRDLLPDGDYVYTLAIECDNDVIAGVGNLT